MPTHLLASVKTEFGKFGGVLDGVKKKLQEASNKIDEVDVRSRAITKKLRDVEASPSNPEPLLPDLLPNEIDGEDPPVAVHVPRFRLLVSPVVPEFATQLGVAVDPSVTATFTVIEAPLLKSAREPPASPTMLNSDCCQTCAMSTTLSEAVRE